MVDPTQGLDYTQKLSKYIKANWERFTAPRKIKSRRVEDEEVMVEVKPLDMLSYYLAYYKVLLVTRAKKSDPQLFESIHEGVKQQLEKCMLVYESDTASATDKGRMGYFVIE